MGIKTCRGFDNEADCLPSNRIVDNLKNQNVLKCQLWLWTIPSMDGCFFHFFSYNLFSCTSGMSYQQQCGPLCDDMLPYSNISNRSENDGYNLYTGFPIGATMSGNTESGFCTGARVPGGFLLHFFFLDFL